jgi:type IV fimbrial biogenesis protein FimT
MNHKRWRSRLSSSNRLGCCGGVTLIELMIAMVVAAILIGAAIPSYNNHVANAFVTGAIKNLSDSIATARAEAIRYGIRSVSKAMTSYY